MRTCCGLKDVLDFLPKSNGTRKRFSIEVNRETVMPCCIISSEIPQAFGWKCTSGPHWIRRSGFKPLEAQTFPWSPGRDASARLKLLCSLWNPLANLCARTCCVLKLVQCRGRWGVTVRNRAQLRVD